MITANADGSLEEATIGKDLGDDELNQCILGYVRKLAFPRPDFGGRAKVVFPLTFSPPARRR